MTDSHRPRRTSRTVLVVITAAMALISLLLPSLPVEGSEAGAHLTPIVVLPFSTPLASASDVFAFVLICLVVLGLVVPSVLLIRAVVRCRSGRPARALTAIAGVGILFWGFFVLSFAMSPWRLLSLVASIAMLLAGTLTLIGQYVVLGPSAVQSQRAR